MKQCCELHCPGKMETNDFSPFLFLLVSIAILVSCFLFLASCFWPCLFAILLSIGKSLFETWRGERGEGRDGRKLRSTDKKVRMRRIE